MRISLLITFAVILIGAASSYFYLNTKKPVLPQSVPQMTTYKMDFDKIKTLDDVKNVLKLLVPEPVFYERKDSLEDSKKKESIKNLINQ